MRGSDRGLRGSNRGGGLRGGDRGGGLRCGNGGGKSLCIAAASVDGSCVIKVTRVRVYLTHVVVERWGVVLKASAKCIRTAGCLAR